MLRTVHYGKLSGERKELKMKRAEKEMKEKAKKKEKENYAMMAAWGSKSDESKGESDLDDEENNYEVSTLDLNENLHILSKRNLFL